MKTIIIFSEYYYPDLLSSGYYITEIAEAFALNCRVTVITSGKVLYETTEIRNNVTIIRIPIDKFNKNVLFQRLIKFIYISFYFYFIGKKRIKKEDEVICVTNPALFVPVIAYLKIRKKFNLSYFIHDVFPENLVATNLIKSQNPFYKLLYSIFKKSYFKSDRIITCGRDMKVHFEQKLSGYAGEIFFISNWGETDKVFPDVKLKNETLMNLNINSAFVFQFAGNLGRGQGIHNLLSAIKKINDPRAHFLFFGKGVYENEIRLNKDKKITYGGSFKREQCIKFLNACDVAIVSLQEGMLGLGVPSKIYNILSVGKPILYIGEKTSEIDLLIEENKIGKRCLNGSVDSIINGINWFLSRNQDELNEMGQNALKISSSYSKGKIIQDYLSIFNEK